MISKSIMQLDIKLSEAKSSIGIPTFKRDDLLRIALIDLSTLNQAGISQDERESYTTQYRRLAILGDALFDSVLINHLLEINSNLTKKEIDDWRQEIATRDSLKGFAIELGLPNFSSSWNNKKRQSPEKEPNLWGEMFEAVIGAIFLDRECNFVELSQWLCDRFIHPVVACDVDQRWFEEHYGFADEPDMEMHPDYNLW
jgi:dsRNA-specific ribonuclease